MADIRYPKLPTFMTRTPRHSMPKTLYTAWKGGCFGRIICCMTSAAARKVNKRAQVQRQARPSRMAALAGSCVSRKGVHVQPSFVQPSLVASGTGMQQLCSQPATASSTPKRGPKHLPSSPLHSQILCAIRHSFWDIDRRGQQECNADSPMTALSTAASMPGQEIPALSVST